MALRSGETFVVDSVYAVNPEPLPEVASVIVYETIEENGVLTIRVEPASAEDSRMIEGWLSFGEA